MKWLAFLVAIVLIAGCVGQTIEAPTDTTPAPTGPEEPQKTAPEPVTLGISVTDAPTATVAGSRFAVTWEIASPAEKSIEKTGIYYGRISHAGEATTALSPDALDYQSGTTMQKGTAPSSFNENVLAGDNPGKIYFRAYALMDGLHYWSDEYVVEVVRKPSIEITDFPESVGKSSTFSIKWDVKDGYPGKVDKTYIMWGIRSGQYTDFSTEQTGNTPASFEAGLTAPSLAPETLYFLITAVVDGKAYNSTEETVKIY